MKVPFKTFLGLLLSVVCLQGFTQSAPTGDYMIAFYNVENLFDTINDPQKKDEEFTPSGENQWNGERYQNKLNNLARVISSMNNGKGPDVLGLCEIENFRVLKDLVNHPTLKKMYYGIVHIESKDERGIDVAMLYKENELPWVSFSMYPVPLPDTVPPTRDVMVVQTELGETPVNFIICHFPSRSEGREKSEYKRISAAWVVKHITDSIKKADPKDNFIIMGDFNDEPFDSSMSKIIGACDAGNMDKPCPTINLMYPLKTAGKGSYKYKEEWNMLDQVIINSGLYLGNGLQYVDGSATIYAEDWMKQTEPKYLGSPLRTFGGRKYLAGFSDHFPVYIYLNKK